MNIALNDHIKNLKTKGGRKHKEKAIEADDWYETFLKAVTSQPVVDAVVKSLGVEDC